MQASDAVRNNIAGDRIEGRLVRHLDTLEWQTNNGARWACAFGPGQDAQLLSLHVAELESGSMTLPPAQDRERVIYVLDGRGHVRIDGQLMPVEAGDGVHIRKGETLGLGHAGDARLRIVMAVCPGGEAAWEVNGMPEPEAAGAGGEDLSGRVVSSAGAGRETTGDRYFKILVGPKTGSRAVTQFIGSIPRSRAPEHFHLYEEVICVLSGEGKIWLGEDCLPVRPGSLIFLPRKQPHCLECTADEGLELLGMFYPAGSPAVNYETQSEE